MMGEMADMLFDSLDEYGEADSDPRFVCCKYCGEDPLLWGRDEDDRWRLFDEDGILHQCKKPTIKKAF